MKVNNFYLFPRQIGLPTNLRRQIVSRQIGPAKLSRTRDCKQNLKTHAKTNKCVVLSTSLE